MTSVMLSTLEFIGDSDQKYEPFDTVSHQCTNLETCSLETDNCYEKTDYGISLQSKQTRSKNIVMTDCFNTLRTIENTKKAIMNNKVDHHELERKKYHLKKELLRLQ